MEMKTESRQVKSDIDRRIANDYGIHQLRINTPLPDLKVNIYFVEKPVPTLIDTPPDAALCFDELNVALLALGYSVEGIRRIIVSHPHFDHFGGAQTIADVSGAEILVFEGAVHQVENYEEEFRKEKTVLSMFLKRGGATTAEIGSLLTFYETRTNLARNIFFPKHFKDGERFELASRTFTVTGIPGHTPWCRLLFDENKDIAFSGDFLVNDIPSNPLVLRAEGRSTDYRSLTSYKASLEAVKRMNLKILLPGHGGIIQDPSKKIEDRLKAINKKRVTILRTLKNGSQTAVQITRQLFPNLPQDRMFRGILDVMSHLESLEEDVLVERSDSIPNRFSLITG